MDDIYNSIKQEIDLWDPIGLLEMHAPPDEYHIEIDAIYSKYHSQITVHDLSKTIQQVFQKYFGATFKFSDTECYKVAEKIVAKYRA